METTPQIQCAECGRTLFDSDERQETPGGVFCRSCFDALRAELAASVAAQGEDVPYGPAAVGAVLGAAAGAALWWGFTVVTGITFGLVAVAIGFAAGKGTVLFAGGKRSPGLQGISVTAAVIGFVYASYLVNRSLLLRHAGEQGVAGALPWLPDLELLFRIVSLGFGIIDVIFLAIVVYEGWRIPAPIRLAGLGDAAA